MAAFYSEHDPFAAEWLRRLIECGAIAPGVVDERDIQEIEAHDLAGFTQCHFFAGIGGWSAALRLAGWPDDRPIWTGSCPCQPFSAAGRGLGESDPRHLWPHFRRLIAECAPASVYGEQVASRAGREWLAGVRLDLEGLGYAVGAADLCAAGVGAPHIRQRLWWAAAASMQRFDGVDARLHRDESGRHEAMHVEVARGGASGGRLEHATRDGWKQRRAEPDGRGLIPRCGDSRLSDACGTGLEVGGEGGDRANALAEPVALSAWSRAEWISCADGKARRIEPGLEPLAHGIPGRVGLLRGYGNAIVPELAAVFIAIADSACAELWQ